MRIIYIFLFIVTLSFAIELPPHSPHLGGVAVLKLNENDKSKKPIATYDNKQVATIYKDNSWYVVAGISLAEKSKNINIDIKYQNGKNETKNIKLKPIKYKEQYITLKTNKHVSLSKKNLDRHYKEKAEVKKILTSHSNGRLTELKIKNPVGSKPRGDFGKRRFFNNQPRKPHSGIDLSGKLGDKVYATLDGTVVMAKELFFSGNVIYIDHSNGVISMYAHLDSFDVKVGDRVKKGDLIGRVGKTGRVTGPHLHFGFALNGNMVNPELFF
jgi:murein DD-endopeptidase MepM/ murein hydrolase activator NlpD